MKNRHATVQALLAFVANSRTLRLRLEVEGSWCRKEMKHALVGCVGSDWLDYVSVIAFQASAAVRLSGICMNSWCVQAPLINIFLRLKYFEKLLATWRLSLSPWLIRSMRSMALKVLKHGVVSGNFVFLLGILQSLCDHVMQGLPRPRTDIKGSMQLSRQHMGQSPMCMPGPQVSSACTLCLNECK